MDERTFTSRSEEESRDAAREIAALLPPDAVVNLIGDLGAGKTLLVKAIAEALGADPAEVSSPSFALVHEYPIGTGPAIVHIDGYRLSERPREWFEIGIPEMLEAEGLKFIEWPKEDFRDYETTSALFEIELQVGPDDSRTIRFRQTSSAQPR